MLTKQALARRIREARHKRKMTLKQVERLSGFSSTHISEIERGRTSPTIAALTRISEALQKDPSYFIEDRELEEVCLASPSPATRERAERMSLEVRPLTSGILASRLRLYSLRSSTAFEGRVEELCPGDVCLYMISGSAHVRRGKEVFDLEPGSSLHAFFETSPIVSIPEARTEMFIAIDPQTLPETGGRRAEVPVP